MAIHYFTDKVQLGGTPLTKEEVKELNKYFEENPEKPFRLYWFEEDNNDFTFLKGLKNIKKLHINYSTLQDLDFLSYFPDLEELEIDEIRGSFDISPISRLSSLKVLNLDLRNTKKTADLTYINGLANLEQLYLTGKFKKKSLQLNFDKLKVFCPYSGFEDLASLAVLENLEFLKLYDHKISSLQGIETITSLKKILINNIKIENQDILSPIFLLPQLNALSISYTKGITDFTFIKNKSHLKSLYLWLLNSLESVIGIENLTALETYSHCGEHLHKNKIDFSPLLNLKTLKNVEIKIGKMNRDAEERLHTVLSKYPKDIEI